MSLTGDKLSEEAPPHHTHLIGRITQPARLDMVTFSYYATLLSNNGAATRNLGKLVRLTIAEIKQERL